MLIYLPKKSGRLILAIKESLHFFHIHIKIIIFSVAYDIHIKWYFITIYHPLLSSISPVTLLYSSNFLSFFWRSSIDRFIGFQPSNSICKVLNEDSFFVSCTKKLYMVAIFLSSISPLLLSQTLKHTKA